VVRKSAKTQFWKIYDLLDEPRLEEDAEDRVITNDQNVAMTFRSRRPQRPIRKTFMSQRTQTETTSNVNRTIQTETTLTSEAMTEMDFVYQPLETLPIPNSTDPELNWLYEQWTFLKDELEYVQSCLDILDLNGSNI
jgi:hypothetical protein